MKTASTQWKFQHDTADTLHYSAPTDARGLGLRRDSGYTHVHMGTADGWMQIAVAIRKTRVAEGIAANLAANLAMLGVAA